MKFSHRPTSALWATILLVAGLGSDLFLSCGTNLVAFAVMAAATLSLPMAAAVAMGIWLETQVLGYTVFAYPHDALTLAWGLALGAATLAAVLIAANVVRRGHIVSFAASFAGYELLLAVFALVSKSGWHAFAPAVVAQVLIPNVLAALGIAVLYRLVAFLETAARNVFALLRQT